MKVVSIVKYTFAVIGAAMLAGAFYLYQDTQTFLSDALTAQGTVIELSRSRSSDSTTYRPVVEFKTETGETVEFTSSTGSNPPSYSRGEVVEVFYKEATPEQAKIKGFFSLWGGAAILGGMGAIFFLIGFSIIMFGSRRRKRIKALKQSGVSISAKIQSVGMNESYKVNGRHPYRISAQWQNPNTSKIHIFHSENIWFDPTEHMNKKDDVMVLIESRNPKIYHMDTSFLPKLAD